MKIFQRLIDWIFKKKSVSDLQPPVIYVNPFTVTTTPRPKSVESVDDSILKLPYSSVELLNEFSQKHRSLLFRFMMKKIKAAIKDKQPYTNFFRMGNTAKIARMNRDEFSKSLNEMIVWFSEKEEYEFAAEARDILNELQVSNVIDNK
jgi:hypothetical protein